MKEFWISVQAWININFLHCQSFVLSKELVLMGVKRGVFTDRIVDLMVLLAKYHIFCSKLQETKPFLNVFLFNLRAVYSAEKYRAKVDISSRHFDDWLPYQHCFDSM